MLRIQQKNMRCLFCHPEVHTPWEIGRLLGSSEVVSGQLCRQPAHQAGSTCMKTVKQHLSLEDILQDDYCSCKGTMKGVLLLEICP